MKAPKNTVPVSRDLRIQVAQADLHQGHAAAEVERRAEGLPPPPPIV